MEYAGYQGDKSDMQAVYDFVAGHLQRQGCKARGEGALHGKAIETCLLRGRDATKCAIGCLISDSQYSSDMEIDVAEHWRKTQFPAAIGPLLVELQAVHDLQKVQDWPRHLRELAILYKLSPMEAQ